MFASFCSGSVAGNGGKTHCVHLCCHLVAGGLIGLAPVERRDLVSAARRCADIIFVMPCLWGRALSPPLVCDGFCHAVTTAPPCSSRDVPSSRHAVRKALASVCARLCLLICGGFRRAVTIALPCLMSPPPPHYLRRPRTCSNNCFAMSRVSRLFWPWLPTCSHNCIAMYLSRLSP